MHCDKCGCNNPEGAKFCTQCAAPLSARCPSCGSGYPPAAKFCPQCAAPLARADTPPSSPPGDLSLPGIDPAEGERKIITALFADIKGSMNLMEALDPEQARALLDPALSIMIDAVHRYDGYVVQTAGDGVFGLFGAPAAHEDHPRRAIYAALAMQEEMRAYAERLRRDGHPALEIRIGINTGEMIMRSIRTAAGRVEYTPIGHATGLAARMQPLAPAGSIAVSRHTHALTREYFDFRPLGPVTVKGVAEPLEVYEAIGRGPLRTRLEAAAVRGLSRFVGREAELDHLKRRLEHAKQGRGQLVAVVGEAGVGKSRLFHEFTAGTGSDCLLLRGFSVSYGLSTPYLPIIGLLSDYFGIQPADDEAARREKVAQRILKLDPSLEEVTAPLLHLLGAERDHSALAAMEQESRRQRTLEVLRRLILRESLSQPTIVIFEDLHWIDAQTQAFLDLLAASIASARILLLVNYRPGYQHRWAQKSLYTQLNLDPLDRDDAAHMLDKLLGASDPGETDALRRFIFAKTEGNPFFMEEMVRALIDAGVLVRAEVLRQVRPLDDLKLPPSVQGIIAERIDRLPPAAKELLQTLAVVGKSFTLALARRVWAGAAGFEPMLSELQAAEFIEEQPSLGDRELSFKHSLIQEVAYNSLMSERRKLVHQRVAESIETLYPGEIENRVLELAHHYARSGVARKAAEFLGRAARQTSIRTGYIDAIAMANQALEFLAQIPDGGDRARLELPLRTTIGHCLLCTRGPGDAQAREAFRRARELCQAVDDRIELFRAVQGERTCSIFTMQLPEAIKLGERLVEIARQLGDSRLQVAAAADQAQTLLWLGELPRARECLEPAATLCRERQEREQWARSRAPSVLGNYSLIVGALGQLDLALRSSREAVAIARVIGEAAPLADAMMVAGQLRQAMRCVSEARVYAQSQLEIARANGYAYHAAEALCRLGWIAAASGDLAGAIAQLESGTEAISHLGVPLPPWTALPLAEAYGRAGRTADGLRLIDALAEQARRTGLHLADAMILSARADVLLHESPSDRSGAEQLLRRALRVAREQAGLLFELDAAVGLARMLSSSGSRGQAGAVLSETYSRFTEGFETPPLTEARTLFAQLGEG